MSIADLGAISKHELGGLKEQKEDQCGRQEVCEMERGDVLGRSISGSLTWDSPGQGHVIPELCCSN